MDSLIASFLSLPNVVIYAIFGAVGGGVGSLLGAWVAKVTKKQKLALVITVICMVVAIQLPGLILPKAKQQAIPDMIVQELKQQRLFALIFRLHPEAEKEMKKKMGNIAAHATSNQDAFYEAQAASAEIISRYFNKHMLSASDEMTFKQIQREAKVIASLQDKPRLCVSYYLGKPEFSETDVTPEFLEEDTNLKADVIESSVSNPSPPPKAASIEDILTIIADAYQKKGYDVQSLAKLDKVETLPPEEGCKLAIEFSGTLASMEMKQATYVFKNLLYLAGTEP